MTNKTCPEGCDGDKIYTKCPFHGYSKTTHNTREERDKMMFKKGFDDGYAEGLEEKEEAVKETRRQTLLQVLSKNYHPMAVEEFCKNELRNISSNETTI